ncbi:tetratricopeptide repeat protein [Sphingomonas koreensis]|nr:tetratricopeptide repeat protein [Sphingomonas koreensis]
MLKQFPIQIWLLIAIAATAFVPARYLFRFLRRSPSHRDITKPADNLDWRTPEKLSLNVAVLVALAALALFIFTPAAAQLAQAPIFWPIVLLAVGIWVLSTVVRGFLLGRIQPMSRGYSPTFDRRAQPKRYWASMGWNAVFGCLILGGSIMEIMQAPTQALEDGCYDEKTIYTAREKLAACNKLIGERTKSHGDLSGVMNARGSAYYRLADYQRARTDYAAAARLDPKDSSSRYDLGLVDEQLGNREEAVSDYTSAIKASDDDSDAYLNRGTIFLETARFDKAIADFSQVLKLRPEDSAARAYRGLSYAWKRDSVDAEQDFTAVRRTDPANAALPRGEVILSMNAGNFSKAVEQLTIMLKSDPKDTWALQVRAIAYRLLGDPRRMQADIDARKQIEAH